MKPTYTVTIPGIYELINVERKVKVTYGNDYTLTADVGVCMKMGETVVVKLATAMK